MLTPTMTTLTCHLAEEPRLPHREMIHPAGAVGVTVDTDAEIVVEETDHRLQVSFLRYSPDGGVDFEEDLGHVPATRPRAAAQIVRHAVREMNRQEQAAERELCAAARKERQR